MKKTPFIKSGLNTTFCCEHMNFNGYVEHMRYVIEQTRCDLTEATRETIIDANSPFQWLPQNPAGKNSKTGRFKNGVLLIHGLFDSPNIMLSLADYFRKQNFVVRSLLLPGHGTNPGDLLDIEYSQWLKATNFSIQSFTDEVDNLFLCGFSTGGALILHEILTDTIENLKGLLLFAPALKLLRPITFLSKLDNVMNQTIGGIKWFTRSAEHDYAKYLSFTLNSAHQVHLLTQQLNALLKQKRVYAPIFLVATRDDEVLNTKPMVGLIKDSKFSNSKMLFYSTSFKSPGDQRIKLINSAYPEKRILNFSHMSLSVSPTHPHYGEQGDYHDYLRYELTSTNQPKTLAEGLNYGAVTHTNLSQHIIQRLTYNPDFDNMIQEMDSFIQRAY